MLRAALRAQAAELVAAQQQLAAREAPARFAGLGGQPRELHTHAPQPPPSPERSAREDGRTPTVVVARVPAASQQGSASGAYSGRVSRTAPVAPPSSSAGQRPAKRPPATPPPGANPMLLVGSLAALTAAAVQGRGGKRN